MEGNFVNKFINKFKSKLKNNKNNYPHEFEYVFNDEDVNKLAKQNNEKIKELKRRSINVKKNRDIKKIDEEILLSSINNELNSNSKDDNKVLNNIDIDNITSDSMNNEVLKEDCMKSNENVEGRKEENSVVDTKDSYSNPDDDIQMMIKRELIKLDIKQLDKYIDRGKDILNHNYSVTYGDDALRYVYVIRDKYGTLIEYFIGFNNEKKGLYDKKIFSNRLDEEWRFLKNYVVILEMIKKLKK